MLSPTSSSAPTTTATWQNPAADGGAPYTGFTWSWCQSARCSTGSQGAPLYLQAPGPGAWTLTVRTVDAAGKVSAPASVTFSYSPSSGGAALPPLGGGKGLATRLILNTPSVRRIPSRTVVSVSGRVEAGHGTVAVRVYYVTSRGRDRESPARKTAVHGGRFEERVPLPGRDRVRFVVVTFVDPTRTYATARRCASPRGAPALVRRPRVC
jgi:hypothetical protein